MSETITTGRAGRAIGLCRQLIPMMDDNELSAVTRVLLLTIARVERDTKASIERGLADSAAGRVSEHPEFLDITEEYVDD